MPTDLPALLLERLRAGDLDASGEVIGTLCAFGDRRLLARATTIAAGIADGQPLAALATAALTAATRVQMTRATTAALDEEARSLADRISVLLAERPDVRPATLADALQVDRSQISRALHRLVETGLVEQSPRRLHEDRRVRRYRLTPRAATLRDDNPFAAVASLVDEWSYDRGLLRSDMLPLGPGDALTVEPASDFVSAFATLLQSGSYRVSSGLELTVPKRGFGTRPATLAAFPERVLLAALTSAVSSTVEASLPDETTVFWPRGAHVAPQWDAFEAAPVGDESPFILTADIAGFYESINHETLLDSLRAHGASVAVIDALGPVLGGVMQRSRGLPQGLAPSDTLATMYLAEVDRRLARDGVTFYRHGDDYRFPADSVGDARRIGQLLHGHLRAVGLLPNTEKTRPIPRDAYLEETERDQETTEIRQVLAEIAGLVTQAGALGEAEGHDEEADAAWTSPYEEFDGLEPVRLPQLVLSAADETDVIAAADHAIEKLLQPDTLHRDHAKAMRRLANALAPAGLGRVMLSSAAINEVLAARPEATRIVSRYLRLVADTHPELAMLAHQSGLERPDFQDAQEAWLLHSLISADPEATAGYAPVLLVRLRDGGWLTRFRAAALLLSAGALTGGAAQSLWSVAPPPLRPDALLLVRNALPEAWARDIWETQASPVERVLMDAIAA